MGSLTRWCRGGSNVLASFLLGLLLLVAPLTATAAAAAVQRATDEHWRGAYDILVLGEGSRAAVASGEQQLIDPNFGNVSGPTISDALLAEVQAIPEVEVAAPLAFLGRLGAVTDLPNLQVPAQVLREHPRLVLDLDLQLVTSDGLGERLAGTYYNTVLAIDSTAWDGSSDLELNDPSIRVTGGVGGGAWMRDGVLRVVLLPLPSAASSVFAIDPELEAELLGAAAPHGVDTLVETDRELRTIGGFEASAPTVGHIRELGPSAPEVARLADAIPDFWSSPALRGSYGAEARLAPVLQADDVYPPLEIRGSVSRVVTDRDDRSWGTPSASDDREMIGEVSVAVDDQLQPFRATSVAVPWPGEPAAETPYAGQSDIATGVSGLHLTPTERLHEDVPAFEVHPQGIIRPVPQDARRPDDGAAIGQTQSYRDSSAPSQLRLEGPPAPGTGAPLIVGSYDADETPAAIRDVEVPVGAYDPARASWIARPDGSPVPPTPLEPTLHGLGLVAQPSAALTTYLGASAFGMSDVTTAIRVRIAGIENYSESAVLTITSIAEQIERLGLDTYVMAGASTVPVDLYVDSYAFGTTDSASPQSVGALGWVRTNMIALGVAGAVVEQLNELGRWVAGAVTLTGLLAVPGLIALRADARRRTTAVLLQNGYTYWRRWWWHLSEAAPTIGVIAISALAAALLYPNRDTSHGAWTVVLLSTMLIAGAAWSARSARPTRTSGSRRPARRASWGATVWRLLTARLVRSALLTVLISGVSFAALGASTFTLSALHSVAQSALGTSVAAATAPAFVSAIGLGGAIAGVVLAAAVGFESKLLAHWSGVLHQTAGWTRGALTAVGLFLSAIVFAAALVLSAYSVTLLSETSTPLQLPSSQGGLNLTLLAIVSVVTLPVSVAIIRALRSATRARRVR